MSTIASQETETITSLSTTPHDESGKPQTQFDIPAIVAIAGAVVLFLVIAYPMLTWWFYEYTKPESYYSHGFVTPFLSALMLWHRRDALRAAPKKTSFAALFLLIPSLVLFLIAVKSEMEAVMSTSFLLTIVGGVWFLFGAKFLRAAAFPLAFLWFMAPLPGPVLNDSTLKMQSLSTMGAAKMLQLFGLNPTQMGSQIHMENYTLNVDVPCSGFKLLLRLLTFSIAFAYLTDSTVLKRFGLFLISLPLSLFINSLRIALVGVVGECLGSSAAHSFHDRSGEITTVLCMVILFACAKGLGCRSFAGQPIF